MQTDGKVFQWNDKSVDSIEFYELYTELMSIFIERELSQEEKAKADAGDRELLVLFMRETGRMRREWYRIIMPLMKSMQ